MQKEDEQFNLFECRVWCREERVIGFGVLQLSEVSCYVIIVIPT